MSANIEWYRQPKCEWVRQRHYHHATKPHRFTQRGAEVVGVYGSPNAWTILYLLATVDDGAGPWTEDKYNGEMVRLEQPSKIDSYEKGERRTVAAYWKEYDEHWASVTPEHEPTPEPKLSRLQRLRRWIKERL